MRKTLGAFVPNTSRTTLLVDLHGYDAFPALASLEDTVDKKSERGFGFGCRNAAMAATHCAARLCWTRFRTSCCSAWPTVCMSKRAVAH